MATGELPLRTHRLPLKMRNLTKRDLVMRVSTETGITQEKVQRIIELALSSITESLAKNENVELRKLGFSRPAGKKKSGKESESECPLIIPPRMVVRFKIGRVFKKHMATFPLDKLGDT